MDMILNAEEQQLLAFYRSLDEAQKPKFQRYVMRISNGDRKAIRYGELYARGAISLQTFLEAM